MKQLGLIPSSNLTVSPKLSFMPLIQPLPNAADLGRRFDYDASAGTLTWKTGPKAGQSLVHRPQVRFGGSAYLPRRIAWKMGTGRDPIGTVVNRHGALPGSLRLCDLYDRGTPPDRPPLGMPDGVDYQVHRSATGLVLVTCRDKTLHNPWHVTRATRLLYGALNCAFRKEFQAFHATERKVLHFAQLYALGLDVDPDTQSIFHPEKLPIDQAVKLLPAIQPETMEQRIARTTASTSDEMDELPPQAEATLARAKRLASAPAASPLATPTRTLKRRTPEEAAAYAEEIRLKHAAEDASDLI